MASVALQNLVKRFPRAVTPAVDGIDLVVADGEFFSLVGPSGCGKTTTLRMVAGFERPTSGQILFADRPVAHLPPQARNVGLVFQNYAVFPTMTVLKNVLYGLEVRKVPRAEALRRAERVVSMVGLTGLEERKPAQLSGGQLQRVALARALVIEPSLLLLDEPLSNLDAKLRLSIRKEIRKLQQQLGITTIYVTHDQQEALSISDRLAVMDQGRLVQVGTPFEVYRSPALPFVADFLGTTTILDGEVSARDGDDGVRIRVEGGGTIPARLNGEVLAPGDRVWVSIRPEALSLAEAGSVALQGTIEYAEFLGSVVRGEFRAAGWDRTLTFELPASMPDVRVGRALRLSVDPTLVRIGAAS